MISNGMRIVMLSTDKNIFVAESSVQKRMMKYGTLFSELSVVYVGRGTPQSTLLTETTKLLSYGGSSKRDALFKAMRGVRKLVQEEAPDVVSAQNPFFVGLVGLYSIVGTKTRLHVQVHTDFTNSTYVYESMMHVVERILASFILHQASGVRVVSKRIYDSVISMTHAPITILPIAVEPLRASLKKPSDFLDVPSLLVVSRLAREKNISLVIDALAQLPEFHLYIVGDGNEREALETQVKKIGVSERVHFLGWQHDVQPFYMFADIFVQCSRYEGYGMSILEAARAGTSIITTDVGIVGDVLPADTVCVIKPTVADVARQVRWVQEHPEEASTIRARAKVSAEGHTLTEEAYLKAYKTMMENCI